MWVALFHGPGCGTALRHQHGHSCSLDPEPPCDSWGHRGPPDINTDPNCGRTMDPDMFFGSSLDPDVTMAPGVCTCRSDPLGPLSSMALSCQPGSR